MTEPTAPPSAQRFDFLATVPTAQELGRVHFIAVGGSGVSGVALLFIQAGIAVSGSDAAASAALETLREAGATIYVGHDPDHLGSADTVIISGAVTESNPELAAARARGLRVLHRAQGIAALSRARDAVAVAGANGKTTTSAMLVAALGGPGADPGFVIGSVLVAHGLSAHAGTGPMVIEADESDGSFLAYRPRVAIVTNVTPDHLDFYGDFAAVQRAFDDFVATVGSDGVVVTNADDPGSVALAEQARARGQRVLTWGERQDADLRISDLQHDARVSSAALCWNGPLEVITSESASVLSVPMPGRHNLHNAAAALLTAVGGFGCSAESALSGLASFAGTRRRFESVGRAAGVEIIDDYAHNPAKVAAVVSAGRSVVPGTGRLVVAFQPHLYSRTAAFADDFAAALAGADVAIVLDVFGAREAPVPGVSGQTVIAALHRQIDAGEGIKQPDVHYAADRSGAARVVAGLLARDDVLLTVGAGDVTFLGTEVLKILRDSHA